MLLTLEIASGLHHVSVTRYLIKSNSDSFIMAERYSFLVFFFLPWAQIFRNTYLRNHLQVVPMSSTLPFNRIQKFTQMLPRQNYRMISLFPLSNFNQTVLLPYKASLSHYVVLPIRQMVLFKQKQKILQRSFLCL